MSILTRLYSLTLRTSVLAKEITFRGANLLYCGAKTLYKKNRSFARNVCFLLNISSIFGWEYTCYLLGRKRIDCLKNSSRKLYNTNKFSIKLFQVLSSTVGILTNEEISCLKEYTDNSPYTSNDIDTTVLKTLKEVGKINNEYMITLESDINSPIHSGMVALVYKGRMENGKSVVIKVLRNKINEILVRDYESIQFLLDIIVYFFNSVAGSLIDVFAEFKSSIIAQTGFSEEQDNLLRMRSNFKNVNQIVIPYVYEIFNKTNENIIVMDYIDGKTIFELRDIENEKYAVIIFEMMTKSILYDGMFHGDLHPGNILFLKEDEEYKVGMIDFGIIEKITREDQYGFFKLVKNIYLGYDETIKNLDEFIETFIGPIETIKGLKKDDYEMLTDLIRKNVIDCLFYDHSCLNISNLYILNSNISKYGLTINKNISKSIIAFVIADRLCVKLSPNKTYKRKINEIFELFDGILLENDLII